MYEDNNAFDDYIYFKGPHKSIWNSGFNGFESLWTHMIFNWRYILEKYHYLLYIFTLTYIQGVLLPDRQRLRGDGRHEDNHY